MRRTLAVLCLCAVAGLGAGCGSSDNSNAGSSNNATRNGIVESNSNMSPKPSNQSNVATVVNDNGNDNTAGVKSMNDNAGHSNANKGNANKGNANTKGNSNH
jgi:hypothetical protein